MKKYFLFLIFILFVTGCAAIKQTGPGKEGPLTGSPNGLEIRFLPEQPPSLLFEGGDVNIGIELKNNAACDAQGKLWVNDITPSSRGGITDPLQRDFNIPGAAFELGKPKIDKTNFNLQASPYINIDRPEGLDVNLEATAIYNCKINVAAKFCVKSGFLEDKTCKSVETLTGNQLKASVAPITITQIIKRFGPESGGVKLVTDITLSKMNKGYVSNSVNMLNPLEVSQEDPINVYVDFEGNVMECNSISGRDFRNNNLYWKADDTSPKTIRCSTLINVADKVNGYLNVNLDYIYKITESKSIKITKLSNNI